jgi:hypothetical protein
VLHCRGNCRQDRASTNLMYQNSWVLHTGRCGNDLTWCQQTSSSKSSVCTEGSKGGAVGVHGDNSVHGQRSNTTATGPFADQSAWPTAPPSLQGSHRCWQLPRPSLLAHQRCPLPHPLEPLVTNILKTPHGVGRSFCEQCPWPTPVPKAPSVAVTTNLSPHRALHG